MSKYDVEVEARLGQIENDIKEIKEALAKHSHPAPPTSVSEGGDVQSQLDDLVKRLSKKMKF